MKTLKIEVFGSSYEGLRKAALSAIENEEIKEMFILKLLLSADVDLAERIADLRQVRLNKDEFFKNQELECVANCAELEKKFIDRLRDHLTSKYPKINLGDEDGWKRRVQMLLSEE